MGTGIIGKREDGRGRRVKIKKSKAESTVSHYQARRTCKRGGKNMRWNREKKNDVETSWGWKEKNPYNDASRHTRGGQAGRDRGKGKGKGRSGG